MGDPSPENRPKPPIGVAGAIYFWDLSFIRRTVSVTWMVDGQPIDGPTWKIEDLPERNPGAQAGVGDGQRAQQLMRFVAGQISLIAACAPEGVHSVIAFRDQWEATETSTLLRVMLETSDDAQFDHYVGRAPIPDLPTRIMLQLN